MDDDSIIVSEVLVDRLEELKRLRHHRNEGIATNTGDIAINASQNGSTANTEGIVVNLSAGNGFRFTPGMPPETVSAIESHGRFIKRLLKVWDAHPELRFGQLLMNVFGSSQAIGTLPLDMAMITRLYYLSDEALFKELEKFYAGRDEPEKEQTYE